MLEWHSATRSHRAALRNFQCADPANAEFDEEQGFIYHDAPWEFEVQEHLCALNPPYRLPTVLLVGFDDVALAAVIELRVSPLDDHVFVSALGVAHRVSHTGLADEALSRIANVMRTCYGKDGNYLITANIDPENSAAQTVFARNGFETLEKHGRYDRWFKRVE